MSRRTTRLNQFKQLPVRDLLATRSWRQWTLASMLARMPVSMGLLGLILAGEEATGSLATGAHLAGTMMFTAGLLGPWRGARMDRREMCRALQESSLILAVAFVGLAAAVAYEAPTTALFASAILAGTGLAGMWGGFRALLLVVVTPAQLRQAHYVESMMVEVTYLLGPLSIGLIVGLTNAVVAVLVMAGFALSAAVALRGVTRLDPRPAEIATAPWRSPAIAVIYFFAFFVGFGFASVESNIAARMEPYGLDSDRAGTYLALLGLGSVLGGVAVSIRPLRSKDPARLAALLFFAFALMLMPSALAGTAGMFGLTLLFASIALVPLNGLGAAELEHRIGDGRRGEAFSWYIAATMMGGGIGSALSGTLAREFEPRVVPMVSAATFATCGVLLLVIRRVAKRSGELSPVGISRSVEVLAPLEEGPRIARLGRTDTDPDEDLDDANEGAVR